MSRRSLEGLLQALPREVEPPVHVWNRIRAEMAGGGRRLARNSRNARIWVLPRVLPAAAAVVLAVIVAIAGMHRSAGTALARGERPVRDDSNELLAKVGEQLEEYELARDQLLESLSELERLTGDVTAVGEMTADLFAVDEAVDRLVAQIRLGHARPDQVVQFASLHGTRLAMLGDADRFIRGFLD